MEIDFSTLLDRAASDPDFFQYLIEDPLRACREVGYHVSATQLKDLLGLPDVDDDQLGEALLSRLRKD